MKSTSSHPVSFSFEGICYILLQAKRMKMETTWRHIPEKIILILMLSSQAASESPLSNIFNLCFSVG
jgi:hypothetical protein